MIYSFATKDPTKLQAIVEYFTTKYSTSIVETTDIDWGNGSNQSKYYTFYSIEPTIDIQQTRKDLKTYVRQLNGTSFYTTTVYIPQLEDYTGYIQQVLNKKAQEYQYDNIVSACSYTASSNLQFKRESLAFVAWRDQLWGASLDELKAQINAGNPPEPDAFIDGLPTYESFLAQQQ